LDNGVSIQIEISQIRNDEERTAMMETNHVEKTIDEIVRLKGQEKLLPNREYQRGAVWDISQKKRLVDSVMRGYPLPLLYLHHKTETAAGAQWGSV
jgi:hypothetical protein